MTSEVIQFAVHRYRSLCVSPGMIFIGHHTSHSLFKSTFNIGTGLPTVANAIDPLFDMKVGNIHFSAVDVGGCQTLEA